MLGENHSLRAEFPEHLSTISDLIASDENFAEQVKKYDSLDKEIRVLELNGAPIGDQAMNQLKLDRTELKDWLFLQLNKA
ncbi:YdcH family protein [Motilimonas sp. E26]|uniref:YdcH family protein n=1 Tax=Motilimonas sp. E26 TaxID=2865674 RepID=UPI001E3F9063|nr:YdcH family protein [Motilimonas sp. E26]MCE0559274.1 YdcH family protein [Motilimonas sp. E26]